MDEFNTSTPISNRRHTIFDPRLSAIRGNVPPPDFTSTALGSPIISQKSRSDDEIIESSSEIHEASQQDASMMSYRSEQDMSVDETKRLQVSQMDYSAQKERVNSFLTDDDSRGSDTNEKENENDDSDDFGIIKRKAKLRVITSDDSESDLEIPPAKQFTESQFSEHSASVISIDSDDEENASKSQSAASASANSRSQSIPSPSLESGQNVHHVPVDHESLQSSSQAKPPVDRAFNFDMYDRLLATDKEKRLFGGKMTENRMDRVVLLTNDALASLHTALSTAPDETHIENTPEGLKIDLMPHQKQGLAWMLWRERQFPPCGILGDDMGLGKTLSIIALILKRKNDYNKSLFHPEDEKCRKQVAIRNNLIPSRATLVVAPASLILQWQKEVKDRVQPGRLSVTVYHGNNRENDPKRLARYDIVITTYGTVTSEMNIVDSTKSIFNRISWERVVLDEAHNIKNRKTQGSRLVCQLSSVYRWCLTGTPIHNELWDLFSLIRFLRITPFSDEGHWKQYIMGGSGKDSSRLNTLVKGVLLRRTKNQIDTVTNKPIVELRDRSFTVVKLDMKGIEDLCYQQMFEASRQKAMQLVEDNGSVRRRVNRQNRAGPVANPFLMGSGQMVEHDRFRAMSCLLTLLLRLRQACVHLCLTRNALDLDAFKAEGVGIDQEEVAELERTFSNIFVSEPNAICGDNEEQTRKIEEVFSPNFCSTKIRAVLSHLDQVIEKKEKCVIVSQWVGVLDIIEKHLVQKGIPYTSITGQILPKHRQDRIDSFNRVHDGAEVMLLSLTAGGVGLNLVGGNHLFIVDLHWNPAMENQACDRIYRMGQTKNVFIHKFVCERTIENRVLDLQQKKTVLADTVLSGVASKKLTKLTMNDLKFLFELDNRGRAAPRTAPQSVPSEIPRPPR